MAEIKKGAWSPVEDQKLKDYIMRYGIWNWRQMPKYAGLSRTGKSCRLRWVNYLRPDIKRGPFSMEEVEIVVKMYQECGNRWSTIAANLPGRTDNEVKNFFHTHLKMHLGVKNDVTVKTKGRSKRVKKTNKNEKKLADNAQERSADVASPCSSVVICEENHMMDVMDFSKTYQDCYNVSSLVDQSVINMENTVILESNPETSETIDAANCQLHQFDYSHLCSSLFDDHRFNSLDMNSFWSDVIADSEHLNF